MKTLAIDIGNSNTKVGRFLDQNLMESRVWSNEEVNELLKYCYSLSVQASIVSSTSVIPKELKACLQRQHGRHMVMAHSTAIPIGNEYDTPQTLGLDRLSAAVGAIKQFPSGNRLIIDAGTCVTYDFVDEYDRFQGGNISPGLEMRYEAMHHFTAKLPLVEVPSRFDLTAKNTQGALQSGGLLGLIAEIEGVMSRYMVEYPSIKCIITGGAAKFLAGKIKYQIFVAPNLILEGLNSILRFNILNEE